MAQKIVIDLHNGTKLVAEEGCDSAYPNEIYIGIMSDDDVFWQDLAVVREKYAISNGEPEYIEDKFEAPCWQKTERILFTFPRFLLRV